MSFFLMASNLHSSSELTNIPTFPVAGVSLAN